jgi:hypothetical protein
MHPPLVRSASDKEMIMWKYDGNRRDDNDEEKRYPSTRVPEYRSTGAPEHRSTVELDVARGDDDLTR